MITPQAGTPGCSSANDNNNNSPRLLTTTTPAETTNPVEFSIPDDFYKVPEYFDLDLNLEGRLPIETTTKAVPQTPPVAARTSPDPELPRPAFILPLQPITPVVWVYTEPGSETIPFSDPQNTNSDIPVAQILPKETAPSAHIKTAPALQPETAPALHTETSYSERSSSYETSDQPEFPCTQ